MKLRELKETAHQQFVRGKFSQCAQTYQQVLRLAPRDPNMHVRHAEASRRAGDRQQAITSYRTAAELLLEIGCETRARGALKAALELDPRDQFLQEVVARLESQREEPFWPDSSNSNDELPMLPPLESGLDPVPPPLPASRTQGAVGPVEPSWACELPPIHRVLPATKSAPPPGPPVLLPAQVRSQTPLPPPLPVTTARLSPGSKDAVAPPPPAVPHPSSGPGPRLEVRRLSPSVLAFRSSPQDGWAVIRSHTPLELHVVEDLEKLPPMMQDLPAELTVACEAGAAARAVN